MPGRSVDKRRTLDNPFQVCLFVTVCATKASRGSTSLSPTVASASLAGVVGAGPDDSPSLSGGHIGTMSSSSVDPTRSPEANACGSDWRLPWMSSTMTGFGFNSTGTGLSALIRRLNRSRHALVCLDVSISQPLQPSEPPYLIRLSSVMYSARVFAGISMGSSLNGMLIGGILDGSSRLKPAKD